MYRILNSYSNYCLIGLPHSGKSLLGKKISIITKKGFIETDNIIRNSYQSELSNIIDNFGESEFLKLENKIGKSLHCNNTIISTGGSMVYNVQSINHFKYNLNSKVIYLNLSYNEFLKRIVDLKKRGVINPNKLDINKFYYERHLLCSFYSDIQINVDNFDKDLDKILYEIKN